MVIMWGAVAAGLKSSAEGTVLVWKFAHDAMTQLYLLHAIKTLQQRRINLIYYTEQFYTNQEDIMLAIIGGMV